MIQNEIDKWEKDLQRNEKFEAMSKKDAEEKLREKMSNIKYDGLRPDEQLNKRIEMLLRKSVLKVIKIRLKKKLLLLTYKSQHETMLRNIKQLQNDCHDDSIIIPKQSQANKLENATKTDETFRKMSVGGGEP